MMVTLSEPIISRNDDDERFCKNSLLIPIVEDERVRQDLTDALQYCHLLLLQNGLSTTEASKEISIRSKEIGQKMFLCLVLVIKDILLKEKTKVSDPVEKKVVDRPHSPFIKERNVNNITQSCAKKGVNDAPEMEEIIIYSSDDECNKNTSYWVESKHPEVKEKKEKSQLNHNSSTELTTNNSPKKMKSMKGNKNVEDPEYKQFKEFQIDTWVYKQIKILKNKSVPINAETVKQLALKASAIFSFPGFEPTGRWLKGFTEIYNVSFDYDKEGSSSSVSISTCEEEEEAYAIQGIMFNVKREMTQPFKKKNPFSKKSARNCSVKSSMAPLTLNDFTPILVDLAEVKENSNRPKKKCIKGKRSLGKQKCNGKNEKKKPAVNKMFKELRVNSWVFEQLKILKKNFIAYNSKTAKELALKAGEIFFQSKFKPGKNWTKRFWKVYREPLERFEEDVSEPTKSKEKNSLDPQLMEEDTSMNNQKEAPDKVEIKLENNSSTKGETSLDYIPLSMTDKNPVPEEIWLSSSSE